MTNRGLVPQNNQRDRFFRLGPARGSRMQFFKALQRVANHVGLLAIRGSRSRRTYFGIHSFANSPRRRASSTPRKPRAIVPIATSGGMSNRTLTVSPMGLTT